MPSPMGSRQGPDRREHLFVYDNQERKQEGKIAVSYITGSHSIKAGFENRWANAIQENDYNGDVATLFTSNNVPLLAAVTNGPSLNKMVFNWDGGVYIQDQWRLGNFTINLGARYDKFNAYIPAQSVPDSNFVQGYSIPRISDTPNWNDWATRTGMAWDVFGNGKTAVKAFAGRFIAGEAFSRTAQFNPIYSRQDNRAWTDLNGDGKVLNPDQSVQFNEIGIGSANFGSPDTVDKQDPELKRDKNWTYELTAQQELFSGVQIFGGYYRRHFYDLAWTDNRATAGFVDANNPGDWIPFTYIGPADPNFPNGGNEAITMYNLQPNKIPAVNARQGYQTNAPDDFPHLQRPRNRHERPAAKGWVRDGQPHQRQDAHPRLHGRQSQRPQVLQSDGSVPSHREVRRQLSAAVSDHGEPDLPDLRHSGCRSVPRPAVLRGEPDGNLGDLRAPLHRRGGCDRQPGQPESARAQLDICRLLQDLRHACVEVDDHRPPQHQRVGGVRQHLQHEERRLGDQELRHELAASGVGPARPQHPVRDSIPILRTQRRQRTRRRRGFEVQQLARWLWSLAAGIRPDGQEGREGRRRERTKTPAPAAMPSRGTIFYPRRGISVRTRRGWAPPRLEKSWPAVASGHAARRLNGLRRVEPARRLSRQSSSQRLRSTSPTRPRAISPSSTPPRTPRLRRSRSANGRAGSPPVPTGAFSMWR